MKSSKKHILSASLLAGMMLTVATGTAMAQTSDAGLTSYFNMNSFTIDGDLSESAVFLNADNHADGTTFGFIRNFEGICAGFDIADNTYDSIGISLNGKSFEFYPESASFADNTQGCEGAVKGTNIELFFTYEALGLEYFTENKTIPMAVTLKEADNTCTSQYTSLIMLADSLESVDNCDNYQDAGYSVSIKENKYGNAAITQSGSSYKMTFDTSNCAIGVYGVKRPLLNLSAPPVSIEMALTVNDLPIINPVTLASWRGLVMDISWNPTRIRFSLTKDEQDNILFAALYKKGTSSDGVSKYCQIGKTTGDTFSFRVDIDENYVPSIYVDGKFVTSIDAIDYVTVYTSTSYEMSIGYDNIKGGGFDVELHNLAISGPANFDALKSGTIDEDALLGSNNSKNEIFSDLALPEYINIDATNVRLPLDWKSSDTTVIGDDGKLVYNAENDGKSVVMTASYDVAGETISYEFELTVAFDGDISDEFFFIRKNDANPYLGQLHSTKCDSDFILDRTQNSVGADLGSVKKINNVVITDSDFTNKLHRTDISLYVSDDNNTYRRIKDYDLFRSKDSLLFTGFETEARFVKVHCHISSDEYLSFGNKLSKIITAYCSDEPVGNGGGSFEKIGNVRIKSAEDSVDGVAFVKFADMKLEDGALCEDMRDIRFLAGGRVLRYFIEDDGVYVRIPESKKDEIITLDIYGSNPDAVNLSDADSVFEAAYGNRTIMNVTANEFNHIISTVVCPNGDMLAIGSKEVVKTRLTIRRSKDGGRTWSEPELFWDKGTTADGCAFLVDNGKVWCFFHTYPPQGSASWTLNVAILVSDDNGYTWKNPDTGALMTPYYPVTGKNFTITYCDGIKVQSYDGDGEGIDYVFQYEHGENTSEYYEAGAIYSRDNGKTWVTSESVISFDVGENQAREAGVSEGSIVELPDGTLKMYLRVQYEGSKFLGESTSYDHGLTWEENCTLTKVYSPNTFPVLKRYKDDVLLLWAGNNFKGGTSYFRAPLNLAYSSDGMQTWNKKLDLWSASSEAEFTDAKYKATQPKLITDNYMGGDNIHIAWWKYCKSQNYTLLLEDAEDYIYKTKGAADDFETTSALYEGWSTVAGNATITTEKASTGTHSMKLTDTAKNILRVSRSIPEIYKGEISFDFNLDVYSTCLYVEFKSTYSDSHYSGNRFAFCIDENGKVRAVNSAAMSAGGVLATVERDKWYRATVKFDINSGNAELLLDGVSLGTLPINSYYNGGVCFVHLTDASSSATPGLTMYVDNFRAYEGTSYETCKETPVTFTVKLNREEESVPYSTDEYNNLAKINIYSDSGKTVLIASAELENAQTSGSVVSAEIPLADGTYYAEIVKNGYLTFRTELTVSGESAVIPEIELIPGDIKSSLNDESGDGVVDIDDFIRVLRGFSKDSSDNIKSVVDINEDRIVNVTDLAYIKANYGKSNISDGK